MVGLSLPINLLKIHQCFQALDVRVFENEVACATTSALFKSYVFRESAQIVEPEILRGVKSIPVKFNHISHRRSIKGTASGTIRQSTKMEKSLNF